MFLKEAKEDDFLKEGMTKHKFGQWTAILSDPNLIVIIIMMIMITGIYIALYPRAQSALQHFAGDFARLLI